MINSDRLSLMVMATGPRGSSKTLVMTGFQCERLIKVWIKNTFAGGTDQVYSNYPVGFWFRPREYGVDYDPVYLKPAPLNIEALVTFDEALINCWVFIDEIDQWADREEWYAVSQKLINASTQMIRKRKMSIMGTIQDFDWLNKRMQFQTDIVIKCREAAFSSAGQSHGWDLGEHSYVTFLDKSGVMTGYTYEESQKSISRTFHGRRFWNVYDTSYEFDPLESKTKYKLKVPVKEIQVGGAADGVDSITIASEKKVKQEVAIHHVINDLKEKGVSTVRGPEFWEKVQEYLGPNDPVNKVSGGNYMRDKLRVDKYLSNGAQVYQLEGVNA
jgi:hypothetical protein